MHDVKIIVEETTNNPPPEALDAEPLVTVIPSNVVVAVLPVSTIATRLLARPSKVQVSEAVLETHLIVVALVMHSDDAVVSAMPLHSTPVYFAIADGVSRIVLPVAIPLYASRRFEVLTVAVLDAVHPSPPDETYPTAQDSQLFER
jgi:hypothetical protein